MKKIFLVLALFILPVCVSADEVATSTVTVNVRYQDTLVWNGPVEIAPSLNTSITDNSNQNRTLIFNSALAALNAADVLSDNFSISDIVYYSDFNSLYVRCINIVSPQKNACDNWQYVVNSTYPPVGMDNYTVSDGDVLYFYFGNPRRVTLSSSNTDTGAPVTAKVESYDYVNNAWTALSGAVLGATQPNPDDPYSPLVILSATSDENGFAQLSLGTVGSYNIGLAMDYYFPTEPLSVTEPVAPTPEPETETPQTTSHSGGGRSSSRSSSGSDGSGMGSVITTTTVVNPETTNTNTVEKKQDEQKPKEITSTDKITVKMDIDMDGFLERYNVALQNRTFTVNKPVIKYVVPPVVKNDQVANTLEAVKSNETWIKKVFGKVFNLFGSN